MAPLSLLLSFYKPAALEEDAERRSRNSLFDVENCSRLPVLLQFTLSRRIRQASINILPGGGSTIIFELI
jgi:hypothetical protein